MRIMGIDPGGITGCVLVSVALEDALYIDLLSKKQLGEPDNYIHDTELSDLIRDYKPHLVIVERFEHRNNEFAKLVSLKYIGVVEETCTRQKLLLIEQGASEAKHFATNDKLEKLGLFIRPRTTWKHANDASRHVTYVLCASTKAPDWIHKLRPYILRRLK